MDVNEYIRRYQLAFQKIYRNVNNMIKEHVHEDITTDQFQLMQYIHLHENVTASEIAQAFGVGKSAITALVNRLTEKELISRERNINDRRVIYLHLTEDGRDMVKETEVEIYKYIEAMLSHFDDENTEKFLHDLEILSNYMENDDNKGGQA